MSIYLLSSLLLFAFAIAMAVVVGNWREAVQRPTVPEPLVLDDAPTMTVVVPARNEEEHIAHVLQDLYAQHYPRERLQVLVVDDASEDRTRAVVQGMMRRWPQLELLTNEGVGKKAAITSAVRAARGDLVLLTDADTRFGPERAASVVAYWLGPRSDMVLLPVFTEGHGPLGAVQVDEQAALLGAAIGSARSGRPMLAYGANLLFSKKAFEQVGGYHNDCFASGDDVFLLHRMRAAGMRISFCTDPHTVVSVEAGTSLDAAVRQRLRWAGKMRGVSGSSNIVGLLALLFPWALFGMSVSFDFGKRMGDHALFTLSFIVATWIAWALPLVKLVGDVRIRYGRERRSLRAFFSLLTFSCYAPVIAVASLFTRPTWKGRKIR